MIINYLLVLFFLENCDNNTSLLTIINTLVISTTLLKKELDIMKLACPKLDKYIENYNNEAYLLIKHEIVKYVFKEYIEMVKI